MKETTGEECSSSARSVTDARELSCFATGDEEVCVYVLCVHSWVCRDGGRGSQWCQIKYFGYLLKGP